MWCYVTRDPDVKTNMQLTSKHSSRNAAARGSRRLLACALAWVCLAAAAVPLAASAQSAVDAGPEMSLVFTAETARLVGSSALVPVRCLGPQEGLCSGTVTLSVKGRKHKAPFSLVGGSAQNLVVPVGGAGWPARSRRGEDGTRDRGLCARHQRDAICPVARILFSRLGKPQIGSPQAFSFNVASVQASGMIKKGDGKSERVSFSRTGGMRLLRPGTSRSASSPRRNSGTCSTRSRPKSRSRASTSPMRV